VRKGSSPFDDLDALKSFFAFYYGEGAKIRVDKEIWRTIRLSTLLLFFAVLMYPFRYDWVPQFGARCRV
jgi:Na+-driven multidrug efflux pump